MQSIDDIFAEEEERLLIKGREEIQAENEVWDSLTPEQRHQIIEASQARFNDVDIEDEPNDEEE